MATNLERSEGWLSRYLDLAKLDPIIVSAVRDVRELTVNQARVLKPLLSGKSRSSVIDRAREFGARAEKPSAVDLVRALTMGASEPKSVKPPSTLETMTAKATGKLLAVARRHGRGGLVIQIEGASGADREEALAAVVAIIERHYSPGAR